MTKTDWGPQLEVAKFEPDMDLDLDGLARFLALSKAFKGIGQARASEIVNRFGNDFDHMVTEEPERLMEIKGVTREIMEGVQEEWLARRSQGKVIAYLSAFGLTPYQVDKLMEIRLLTLDSDESFELLAEVVDRLVAENKLTRFNGKDGAHYIALTGLFNMETYLARVFETWGRP